MKIIAGIIGIILTTITYAYSQNNIDRVLLEVSKNNKTLAVNKQYWETQKILFSTNNNPKDPRISYDYLSGKPEEAGNQHDLTITQEINFPTYYIKKSELAKSLGTQSEYAILAERQNILLETKRLCLELIYLQKLHNHLSEMKSDVETFLKNTQTKFDQGGGNIIELNRVKLQLIEILADYNQTISNIAQIKTKLTGINGGIEILFNDTIFPYVENLPEFSTLENEIEHADPDKKYFEQQKVIADKQLQLSKADWYPKFEIGYRYQGLTGADFHGIHSGISIPLWQNKNTIKLQKSKILHEEMNLQMHINDHYSEIAQKYAKYQALKGTLNEYKSMFETMNTSVILEKAINYGQISAMEYFLELNYFNTTYKYYLHVEKEFYQIVTELQKHKL